ncbi:hypothetical protein ACFY7H_33325 [Streptomyces sp. NPDC012794]|uniref:hypothetical protein n=1 Tax=Streptomyces sp. NPDC012794 TaxID=3364850 RepID=UPI0036CAF493
MREAAVTDSPSRRPGFRRPAMLIHHVLDHGTLKVRIQGELDITNRAAAALRIEALVAAHRPARVLLELPTGDPTPATLSALARTQRMCRSLGVAFTVSDTHPPSQPIRTAGPAHRLEAGARHDH